MCLLGLHKTLNQTLYNPHQKKSRPKSTKCRHSVWVSGVLWLCWVSTRQVVQLHHWMVKRRIECRHKCADIVFGFQVSCGSVGSLPSARPLALSSCVPLAILCSNTLTFWDPDTHYFDALILLYYGTQIHYCYSNTLVFWVPDLDPDILNLHPNTLSNCLTHDMTQRPTHGNTHN